MDNNNILNIPIAEIREDEFYSKLLYPISSEEYEALKKDIIDNGIKVPLIINNNNILLDGYTRLRIAKELKLDTVPCIIESFNDKLEEVLFIIRINVHRRHLNTAQKAEIALKLLELEQERSRLKRLMNLRQYNNNGDNNSSTEVYQGQGQGYTLGNNNTTMTNIGHFVGSPEVPSEGTSVSERAIRRIGKQLRLSHNTIDKARKIVETARKDPKIAELWNEALQGKRSIQAVYDRVKQKEAREAVRPIIEEGKVRLDFIVDKVKILHGDFRVVLKDVPDNSIDLIFTDPPYSKEHIPYLKDLMLLASRVLRPSGFIAVMYGQAFLPELFDAFKVSNVIRYHWMIALHMPDSREIFYIKRIRIHWKPIVVFQKEPCISVEFDDYISRPKPNKDIHEWKQDVDSAMHVIKSLTNEHDVILDPMVGTGTTIEASLILNRRVIEVEKDRELYEMLLRRYSIYLNQVSTYDA